jgi:hypothetical protein
VLNNQENVVVTNNVNLVSWPACRAAGACLLPPGRCAGAWARACAWAGSAAAAAGAKAGAAHPLPPPCRADRRLPGAVRGHVEEVWLSGGERGAEQEALGAGRGEAGRQQPGLLGSAGSWV